MTTEAELSPLFTDVTLSADDADAIVAALHDIAEADGKHAEELEMIESFSQEVHAELGDEGRPKLTDMTPDKLAIAITDPTVRTVAVQASILLAWADGDFSAKEKERVQAYATALDIIGDDYDELEKSISAWVRSGDATPLF